MDQVGRLVVPKALRAELGLTGPTELEVTARDGVIELSVADLPARIEDRGAGPVIVTDAPTKPLTVEDVRAAIDAAHHKHTLVSADRRAAPAYTAMAVDVIHLGSE